MLADRIEGEFVSCEVLELDQYGRSVSQCFHADDDISAWMVEQGYALAFRRYSSRLVPQEDAARASGAGLWQTALEPPWEYRARRWRTPDQEAPEGCPIKGNISINTGAKIYHAPWSPWYEKTRINTAKGERWFCTEGEALAAGWRPPKG